MTALEPLSKMIGVKPQNHTRQENLIIEADLFSRLCNELKIIFKNVHAEYFRLIKLNKEKVNTMIEANFVKYIVQDIITTGAYDLSGIANYTDTPEDVVQEVLDGRNLRPCSVFLLRIIELHKSVREDIYHSIISNILREYLESIALANGYKQFKSEH